MSFIGGVFEGKSLSESGRCQILHHWSHPSQSLSSRSLGFLLLPFFLWHCKKFHHRDTENTEKKRRKKALYSPPLFSSAILCVLCVSVVVFILRFTAPFLSQLPSALPLSLHLPALLFLALRFSVSPWLFSILQCPLTFRLSLRPVLHNAS